MKKIISLLLAGILVSSVMVGCSKTDENNADNTTTTTGGGDNNTPANTPDANMPANNTPGTTG
jgi:hypothetical protein